MQIKCGLKTLSYGEKMPPLTRTLVNFSYSLSHGELSGEVLRQARYLLLDYLGTTLAGSQTESSRSVYLSLIHI